MPFFLVGGTALGLGRGDDIYPLVDLPRSWVVVVRPGFGVSTVEAYGWFDEEPEPLARARRAGRRRPLAGLGARLAQRPGGAGGPPPSGD